MNDKIIGVPISSKKIQRIYDFLSPFYEYLTSYENASKAKALEIADIKNGYVVLEAAFGTGQTLIESAIGVGKKGITCGIDLSHKMLERTRKRVKNLEIETRVDLILGDVRRLPYRSGIFDVVYNSYMLDLIDTSEISQVLAEFKRVLKPGGRLVVVSLSKGENWYSNMKLYEWIYSNCPTLLGGCRPILSKPFIEELGFKNVKREFMLVGRIMPSEIVWGDKPK
jgi:demethylmenaquinone methyltransferase/2-methoxy-6-polyprenyl-1,4-benzoquinol methylase